MDFVFIFGKKPLSIIFNVKLCAHNLTLKIIESGFLPKIKTKSIPLKVMNIQFQNPIGLAAGFDKNAQVINQIHKLGFGFSEALIFLEGNILSIFTKL